MAFGSDIAETHSVCQKTQTGVDAQESITLFYKDGRMATLQSVSMQKVTEWELFRATKGI